jgi:G:T-mismatch repair DNA endonuclease (very short patch repair protein)
MTIASACNKVFRKKFLQPDRIGLIPVGGYTDNRSQSKKAIAWLLLEEKKEGKGILHGWNGKERRFPELPNIHVDGLCEETRTVYEFNGCYYHEHICMQFRDLSIACGGGTLAERYENTMTRLERITQAGYQVKVQWECEFEPPKDTTVEKEHLPLRTRAALYGGRTEAMRLNYRVNDGEETIQYVDIMSLYPWVCKYFKFPVGHPTIHLDCGNFPTMLAKEGLVRYTVLPSGDLYHLVLPYKCNGRLLFCLCRTCAEAGPQERCCHEMTLERALTATWIVDEVRVAVQHGYNVRTIHEFYEYEVTQSDPKTGEGGHFVQYIDAFLNLKAEARGYPGWVQGPEDENWYVQYFREIEGIELDKTLIQKNAAKRGLAKLCLN